ncbi:Structural maintenance of chromosomes protein like [Melia azedarach]|uniref:Structural maintenance of chromosomes protein like n=1 Tax=Melia azedarach TaxID=155640 RepID=A0ACC1Z2K1_MELAZ|nr:Structural maintenance of chromosomes protein like [Melia azedarach]
MSSLTTRITWVGHVYQKFEAMCLEVEDIMYQDTVKYVENQVQTVGASVKKFYSDVLQDALPPSSVDLVKGSVASNLPAEQASDVGICKKLKVGAKKEAIKVDNEQLTEYSLPTATVYKESGHGSSFNGFHIEDTSFQLHSWDTAEGAWSDVYLKECNQLSGQNQSSLGALKLSKDENLPPTEMSGAITRMEKDVNRASSCELLDEKEEASGAQVAVTPIPVTTEVAECRSIEETYDELENASNGIPGVFSNSSSSKNSNEVESAHSSCSALSVDLNDICTNNGVVSLAGSSMNEDVQPSKFSDKITSVCLPGQSDCLTMDTIESIIIVEQGFETIKQVDNIEVEETCVLVNRDEHFVPSKEGKHRLYKKKIQDAISSRMRSRRKREYEQLAVWYGEDVKAKQEYAETKSSPSHSSCEFEWELL